jgi:hypothetical protein
MCEQFNYGGDGDGVANDHDYGSYQWEVLQYGCADNFFGLQCYEWYDE